MKSFHFLLLEPNFPQYDEEFIKVVSQIKPVSTSKEYERTVDNKLLKRRFSLLYGRIFESKDLHLFLLGFSGNQAFHIFWENSVRARDGIIEDSVGIVILGLLDEYPERIETTKITIQMIKQFRPAKPCLVFFLQKRDKPSTSKDIQEIFELDEEEFHLSSLVDKSNVKEALMKLNKLAQINENVEIEYVLNKL